MTTGLKYALSSKLSSEGPRISVISYEFGPSIFLRFFVKEILDNCLDDTGNEKSTFHVHFVNFVCEIKSFIPTQRSDAITIYDFKRNSFGDLETFYESLVKNISSKPEKSHVIVLDDYCLFSILSSNRDLQLQARFLSLVSKRVKKMYAFFHKDTVSADEIGLLYDHATDIALLKPYPSENGKVEVSYSNNKFICDLLKIRTDRRVTHDRSVFQIVSGELKEETANDSSQQSSDSHADLLKNLTTFKLTMEDGERESKNKLRLPYFDAQKTALDDPENFDDFEEDEEV